MLANGPEHFQKVLVKAILTAFRHHRPKVDTWLHLERIEAVEMIERGYRLPPRAFVRHSIAELADRLVRRKKASFILRFQTDGDRRFALNTLANWNPTGRFRRFGIGISSGLSTLACHYDVGKALRGLAKIAINLLSWCCEQTAINRNGFGAVIGVIMDPAAPTPKLVRKNGFVFASDIQSIGVDGAHSFRLLHVDRHWHIHSSFFGGKVGSFVRFPGPNHESWCCADIVAPIRSRDWTVHYSRLLQPLIVRVEWQNPSDIIPSLEIFNVQSDLRVRRVGPQRPN
jgi:hypothetical protein